MVIPTTGTGPIGLHILFTRTKTLTATNALVQALAATNCLMDLIVSSPPALTRVSIAHAIKVEFGFRQGSLK
jgi:hypothetical protein